MMKKTIAFVLFLAFLVSFAACSKNKNPVYVPPETEVVTLENGETVIYEIATGENGYTYTKPYIPPVTDSEGRVVETAAPATNSNVAAEGDIIDVDNEPVIKTQVQTDAAGHTTVVAVVTNSQGHTVLVPLQTNAQGQPGLTENRTNSKGEDVTVFVTVPPATAVITETPTEDDTPQSSEEDDIDKTSEQPDTTIPFAKTEANKLAKALEISNTFDEKLTDGKFPEAQTELVKYIADAKKIQTSVSANAKYLQIVGKANMNTWISKLNTAKPLYDSFIKVYNDSNADAKAKQSSYIAFQAVYKEALVAYYNMVQNVDAYRYN